MKRAADAVNKSTRSRHLSTFECIVDRDKHFFMEMNTRIQVEHRVTELCYSLKFINPDDANDSFTVHSLVEAMVLLAAHAKRLPKPERVLRNNASVELDARFAGLTLRTMTLLAPKSLICSCA